MNNSIPNISTGACIQVQNNIGFGRFYNVCTGTTVEVPWGAQVYANGIVGMMFFILLCVGGLKFYKDIQKIK